MMKIFGIVSFISLLFALSATAAQKINCSFNEPGNDDHLQINLTTDQSGTLQYLTNMNEDPSTNTDNLLVLKRMDSGNRDTAAFTTQVEIMQMTYKLPVLQLTKPGNFKANLVTEVKVLNTSQSQDLTCKTQ